MNAAKEIKRVLAAPHAYAVLGLHRQSTETDAQLARRELARLLHPDRCALPAAADAMARVNVAADNVALGATYWVPLKARKGTTPCMACASNGVMKKSLGGMRGVRYEPCAKCQGAGLILKPGDQA